MAWTVTQHPSGTLCTYDGSSALDLATTHPNGIRLKGVQLWPSAANDRLVIRSDSATGGIFCQLTSLTGGEIGAMFYDTWWKPYILNTDLTVGGTASNFKVLLIHDTIYGEWPV